MAEYFSSREALAGRRNRPTASSLDGAGLAGSGSNGRSRGVQPDRNAWSSLSGWRNPNLQRPPAQSVMSSPAYRGPMPTPATSVMASPAYRGPMPEQKEPTGGPQIKPYPMPAAPQPPQSNTPPSVLFNPAYRGPMPEAVATLQPLPRPVSAMASRTYRGPMPANASDRYYGRSPAI